MSTPDPHGPQQPAQGSGGSTAPDGGGYPAGQQYQGGNPYHQGADPYQQGGHQYQGANPYQQGANPYQGVPQHQGRNPYGYHNAPVRAGSQPGVSVGFVDAVKRFYAKYTQFSGRASRSEYWWVALYLGAISLVLSLLVAAGTGPYGELNGFGYLMTFVLVVFSLAHIVPTIAISIRRLHDANFSGWFYLLGLIPYVGGFVLLVFMVLPSKPEGARFDR